MGVEAKEQFLKTAQARTELIPHLINNGQVLMDRDRFHDRVAHMVGKWFIKDAKLVGEEHIQKAESLVGKRLLITPFHFSDGDHDSIVQTLERNGHPEFARNILFVAGLKMLERTSTRLFMGADPAVFTMTPADLKQMADIRPHLKDGERKIFLEYMKAGRSLGDTGKTVIKDWQAEGKPVLVYVQGGRVKPPFEVTSPPEAVRTFFTEDGYVLPLYATGIQRVMPAEAWVKPWKRTNVVVRAGESYPNSDLRDLAADKTLKAAGINEADIALARILKLAPFLPYPYTIGTEFKQKLAMIKEADPYITKPACI